MKFILYQIFIKDELSRNLYKRSRIATITSQNIAWDEVEMYLKQYVGDFIEIADNKEILYDIINIKKETSTPLGQ